MKEQKCLNLGRKMPDLGNFGLEFENNIVIFEINTLEFVYCQNLAEKQKCLNLGPKRLYLGIFGQKCFIWVFLTRNALFGYFWARILKILLSYLKSAPSNLGNCKILRKNKNTKIWDQKCLIWVFLG